MRIAVMGTGSLGGRYGGALAMAGNDVTFIARSQLQTISTEGLKLDVEALGSILTPESRAKLPADSITLQVQVTDKPAEVGSVDLLLFCVKAYDLDKAAEQARPMVGPHTTVLPVQNGFRIEEKLGTYFGEHAVIGGVQYPGSIIFGEMKGGESQRTRQLLDVFQSAGIATELRDNIQKDIAEKFIGVCATGGILATVRLPIGPALSCPETKELFKGVMEEAYSIAKAVGVDVSEDIVDTMMTRLEGVPPNIKSSQLEDIESGRRLELEDINGAVVRLGKEFRIPTPLNFAVYAALKPYINGSPTLQA